MIEENGMIQVDVKAFGEQINFNATTDETRDIQNRATYCRAYMWLMLVHGSVFWGGGNLVEICVSNLHIFLTNVFLESLTLLSSIKH